METQRAFAAIVISLAILFGYQYFFMPAPQQQPIAEQVHSAKETPTASTSQKNQAAPINTEAVQTATIDRQDQTKQLNGRDIKINTTLYSATISENGGAIKSFKLHNFLETNDKNSPAKELITTESLQDLPLLFNWGNGPAPGNFVLFQADKEMINTRAGGEDRLSMAATTPNLQVTKTMSFSDDSYLIGLDITVKNHGKTALQGSPNLGLTNKPFSKKSSSYLFNGPAFYLNDDLQEIKLKKLADGPKIIQGPLTWAAYEDTYFMCSIIPASTADSTIKVSLEGDDLVKTNITSITEVIQPGETLSYHYDIYFGPKKLKTLQATGHGLDKAVNFGFFDIIAKPTLYLLNFFHDYLHNYGIAIILVTIIFKLIFWPISHKGMKSMKNMQKVQPKMAKLREKYKDDKERLNQEMIGLYKTYKINPLGGCLPMVLQIPVFFALYKVLLQTIELRHAPFMLWITDLSAPDRLFIGIDIPVLGGIPVLTLLMGASMFLQQKMTPSTGDPTQAKMMMFLPIIFTFMFINFASGLVLYWFINNLLSVGQQYFINRSVEA